MDEVASSDVGDSETAMEDQKADHKIPDYKTQKTEIHAALQQRLKQGDTW